MDRRKWIVLSCSTLLWVMTFAQAASDRPKAPAEICANNNCVKAAAAAGKSSGTIKWNPGHYMASEGILTGYGKLSDFTPEMDDLNNYDNILGYRLFVSWGALESAEGTYNFSVLDAMLKRLQTQYHKPKRLVIALVPGTFVGNGIGNNNGASIPVYLQQNPVYGASPVPGSYGWWGQSSGGASTGSYSAAIWRPAVMDRLIALVKALGEHYDAQTNFEALMFQEDSWVVSEATTFSPAAPDYSDSGLITQMQRLLTASTAAFPHTSIVMENTWVNPASGAQSFEQWMVKNRVVPGSADTLGGTAFKKGYATAANGLAWGLQAYMGIQASGSNWSPVDMRSQTHAMMDIEGADIAGTYYASWGAPYGFEPLDVISALNNNYKASHAFWTHYFGSEPIWPGSGSVSSAAPWSQWSKLAPVINSNPLTTVSYPANYP